MCAEREIFWEGEYKGGGRSIMGGDRSIMGGDLPLKACVPPPKNEMLLTDFACFSHTLPQNLNITFHNGIHLFRKHML